MLKFETENSLMYLNVGETPRKLGVGRKASAKVRRAIDLLKNLAPQAKLDQDALDAVECILAADVCLPPSFFMSKDHVLHRDVTQILLARNELSSALYEALDGFGSFDFLSGVAKDKVDYSHGIIARIIATFGLCSIGVDDLESVPIGFVHAFVDLFRSDDGTTWRADVLGPKNPFARQCARATVLGLANLYGDQGLVAKASSNRQAVNVTRSWEILERSTDPLTREVLTRLALFGKTSRMGKVKQTALDIVGWLKSVFPNFSSIQEIMQVRERTQAFSAYIVARAAGGTRNHVERTSNAKRVFDAFAEQIIEENPNAALFPLIPDKELSLLKSDFSEAKPSSSRARALPEKLFGLAKEILDEGEGGWPGENFTVTVGSGKQRRKIYCPVIPTLLRCAFEIPLRIGQLRRLDSGEGDHEVYNADNDTWSVNEGPLAGYWARIEGVARESAESRGYAYRFREGERSFTGINVNTNKTGDPYVLPWQHRFVHSLLWPLRNWQAENNPVAAHLTPDQYLDDPANYPEATKKTMPNILGIFRMFPTRRRPWEGRIVTPTEVYNGWLKLMERLQDLWNSRNPGEHIQIVFKNKKTRLLQKSIYTLHGLRKRGLTTLYKAGVPIEIISKMVAGHATLAMTRYYLDFDPARINDILELAAVEAAASGQRELINGFKSWSFEQARSRTVALQDASIEAAVSSPSKVEYCNVDIGFCPYDASRCWDGGPISRIEKPRNGPDKSTYDRVPGGDRNCVMCRHFITGPEWLNQLEIYGMKLCEKRSFLARREIAVNERMIQLESQLKAKEISKNLFKQMRDAQQSELLPIKDEQEIIENSILNTELLLTASLKLLEADPGQNGGQYVTLGQDHAIGYAEISRFDHAAILTEAARIYPIFADRRLEEYRDKHLNRVLFNSGQVPPDLIVHLTDEQRRASLDLLSKFVLRRTSAEQRQRLVEGTTRLQDLRLWNEVEKIIQSALNTPISLPPADIRLAQLEVLES